MNAGFEKVDEAEKITRQEHAKLSNRNYKVTGVLLVVYLAVRLLHWVIGFPSSLTEVNYGVVSILGVIYLGYVLELLGASFREVRLRSKETNNRLEQIEKQIDSKIMRISKRLAVIESALKVRAGAQEENPDIEDEEADKEDAENAETRAELIAKYRESAERGEAWGQHNLGITYYNGDRGARDYAQAAFWFRKAAVQSLSARLGDESSLYFLAESIYANKEALPSDYEEALQWYRKVSEQNSIWSENAEYTLGNIYETGKGVPKDYIEAVRWWQKAADRGYEMAHYHLGNLFAKGAEGVPQDYSEAYFRLCVAVSGKGLGPMQKYAIGERDEVANHLTPEVLFQTQERAQKWIEAHPKSL
jgi:hypothetical protein